jgi:endonuclease/exonuclease/phosphatase family metal-dependent hydrolase
MKQKLAAFIFTFFCASITHAQLRVVNYNIAKCIGDHDALDLVIDAISLDESAGEAIPVSIFMFQEVSQGKEKVLHQFLGETYSMGTYTNQGESGGAQAMFYNSTQLKEVEDSHVDIFTGATRYADRWELKGIGEHKGISIWVYSMHLKASKGNENKELRNFGAAAILEDIATLPKGSHVIVGGDMNFYTVNEPAYQTFVEVLIDPLGTDEWAGQDDATKHTQSPRKVRAAKGTPGSGLIHGGLDDRFDFQLISESLQDGKGLDIIAGSYRAFGNDGKHYDIAINDGENNYFQGDVARSKILAEALHIASDHIPVIVDYDVVEADKATTESE